MYNKKYRLEKIEEFNKHNYTYDGVEGSICYPAYFNPGERGWFLFEDDWFGKSNKIHTSVIKSVDYIDDQIIVETNNTRLTFRLIQERL